MKPLALFLTSCITFGQDAPLPMMTSAAKVKPSSKWDDYPTRLVTSLPDYKPSNKIELSTFGGLKLEKHEATGFFHAKKIRKSKRPVVYTKIWNFMSSYGHKRGGVYQKSGHMGYPGDCIFVFYPQFEAFCDEYAKRLASTKDDPWV